jgi:hypothetical protein
MRILTHASPLRPSQNAKGVSSYAPAAGRGAFVLERHLHLYLLDNWDKLNIARDWKIFSLRDEHGQHEHRGRDDRLWPVRLHGQLPPGDGLQLDRSDGALCLREPAGHRAVEPGAARRVPSPAAGRGHGGRRRGGPGGAGGLRSLVRSEAERAAGPEGRVRGGAQRRRGADRDLLAAMAENAADWT